MALLHPNALPHVDRCYDCGGHLVVNVNCMDCKMSESIPPPPPYTPYSQEELDHNRLGVGSRTLPGIGVRHDIGAALREMIERLEGLVTNDDRYGSTSVGSLRGGEDALETHRPSIDGRPLNCESDASMRRVMSVLQELQSHLESQGIGSNQYEGNTLASNRPRRSDRLPSMSPNPDLDDQFVMVSPAHPNLYENHTQFEDDWDEQAEQTSPSHYHHFESQRIPYYSQYEDDYDDDGDDDVTGFRQQPREMHEQLLGALPPGQYDFDDLNSSINESDFHLSPPPRSLVSPDLESTRYVSPADLHSDDFSNEDEYTDYEERNYFPDEDAWGFDGGIDEVEANHSNMDNRISRSVSSTPDSNMGDIDFPLVYQERGQRIESGTSSRIRSESHYARQAPITPPPTSPGAHHIGSATNRWHCDSEFLQRNEDNTDDDAIDDLDYLITQHTSYAPPMYICQEQYDTSSDSLDIALEHLDALHNSKYQTYTPSQRDDPFYDEGSATSTSQLHIDSNTAHSASHPIQIDQRLRHNPTDTSQNPHCDIPNHSGLTRTNRPPREPPDDNGSNVQKYHKSLHRRRS